MIERVDEAFNWSFHTFSLILFYLWKSVSNNLFIMRTRLFYFDKSFIINSLNSYIWVVYQPEAIYKSLQKLIDMMNSD